MAARNILLHGSGAIGTIYLHLLSEAGCKLTAVCRSNYDAAKAHGFTLDSELYGKNIRLHPNVVRTTSEAASHAPFDYVLVCTKALPDAKTAETIAPAVTEGRTAIVLVQNGIGIEQEFAKRFPRNPLLSCVVYLPTTQVSPGHVEMGKREKLELGTFPTAAYREPGVKEATDGIFELLRKGGSKVSWHEDIQEKRWNKLLLNASWNPICALTLSRDTAFASSSKAAERLVEDVMLEVVAVSKALGYTSITDESAQVQMKALRARIDSKGIEPSMLADVLLDRRMEVEAILGSPIEVARAHGVPVPRMETLYALGKALDDAIALRQPGQSLAGDAYGAAKEHKANM